MIKRNPGVDMRSPKLSRRALAAGSALGMASLAGIRVPLVGAQDAVEVTWTSWGNTGEVKNLQNFTDDYNASQSAVKAKYGPIPTDGYDAKLLTQLNGGTAPDLFYVGDGQASTLIKNSVVMDLTELLSGATSKSKPEDFAGDLWGPSKTADGKLYGVPVDCNPLVIWYNKKLLQDAGITDVPADLYEKGAWTWDAFQSMLDKIKESGKTPLILDGWWLPRLTRGPVGAQDQPRIMLAGPLPPDCTGGGALPCLTNRRAWGLDGYRGPVYHPLIHWLDQSDRPVLLALQHHLPHPLSEFRRHRPVSRSLRYADVMVGYVS